MTTSIVDFMSNAQESLFDKLHGEYEAHYDDRFSQAYRIALVLSEIAQLIDANVKSAGAILEIASGTGVNLTIPKHLVEDDRKFEWWGNDLSTEMQKSFAVRHSQNHLIRGDITCLNISAPRTFSVIFVLGGMHHMTKNFDALFENISKLLAVDGMLIFVEPNKWFLNSVRRLWYKLDRRFDAENEAAIDPFSLFETYGSSFELHSLRFFGGPGFFVINNSMILRIPKVVKKILTKILIRFDLLYSRFQSKYVLPAFICVWKRKDGLRVPTPN